MTITIRRIRARDEGAEVVLSILLEEGEHRECVELPITAARYCELKPQKGEIPREMYDALEEASQLCQAIRRGEFLLSYGANSERALATKLMQKGFSRQISLDAARELVRMGLINESADLRRQVERCLAKLWGEKRIGAHLWSRGFSSQALEELPALLAEVDFVENCAKMIRKHYGAVPKDPAERRRMVAALCRYGYSPTQIREAEKRV